VSVFFIILENSKGGEKLMALIKYGGGVIQMSGSIAGNTHARNRYGNYMRARTKPTNPNTAAQQAVRNAVAALSVLWSTTLTAAQRAAWKLYGDSVEMKNKLGETIHLSGFNHYIRSNSVLSRFGIAEVNDGPVIFELPATDPLFAISISEAAGVASITFDDAQAWAGEDDAYMFLLQGQPQNPQRNFFGGPWRWTHNISGDTAAPKTSPQLTGVLTFPVSEGQRVWMQARIIRADGRLSTPFEAQCIVAA
jgi:hypothetical protein